ncbi:MAG: HD domain-containing protein [Gemmataceae bacterium]|nr:HD domain-containing protein [Gemmataceae bacterium]
MSDTKALLEKIAALRLRIDQSHHLATAAGATAADPAGAAALEDKVRSGGWHSALLDGVLRGAEPAEKPALPVRLSQRGARLVRQARDLLAQLKALADDPILPADAADPLAELHRSTAGMIDAVLRTVQTFPPSTSAQSRMSEGLEAILEVVDDRLSIVKAAMRQRSTETGRIERLADALRRIAAGQAVNVASLEQLAGEVREEARQGLPLRFHALPTDDPAHAAAAHGLTVAGVLARLIDGDADWQGRDLEGLVAALVHDAGMVRLPAELIAQTGPLTEEQRRLVERHPLAGAQALVKLWPGGGWAIDAAADHHERLDGTGYPKGKRDLHLADEVKLLTVCDVYAALASARPWRGPHEPRTALTDTLLLADRGALDRKQAERLLRLAFYPPGSVVELDDGCVALVLAPQVGERALTQPARPVVTVVREAFGQAAATPRYLDLAQQTERTIVRSLAPAERRQVLGRLYPELV